MNGKCVECIFCKLPRGPTAFVPLKTNLEKFENLLESFDFEQYTVEDLLICFSCNQLLNKFFDFKSKFVEKEDELLNYTDEENTVDLCKVLISKGLIDKNHDDGDDEKLQICRMCYKTTTDDEFAVIEYGSKFNTFITTCIEEFDLFLIHKTFICQQCCNVLLSFYRFLLACIQAVKSVTSEMTASTDPLAFAQKFHSEVEASTTVPEANVEKVINLEPCRSTLDEPPDKKHKVEVDCEIIEGPIKLEVPSHEEQQSIKSSNNDVKIVDVQKLLNPSNRITPSDIKIVETSDLETACKKKSGRPKGSISRKFRRCLVCLTLCRSVNLLTEHIKEMHSNENNFICFKCKACVTTLQHLKEHLKFKHKIDMYRPLEESNHRVYRPKISTKGTFKKPTKCCYECQICPVQDNSYDEIMKHIASHLAEKFFTCWVCQKILEGGNRVEIHFKREHRMGLYKIIQEIDESDILLQDTKGIVPKKIKMFECHICWLHIYNIFELQEHFSYHIKLNKFVCFNCTFRCSDFQEIRNHLASKHGISSLYRVIQRFDQTNISENFTLSTENYREKLPISCPKCHKKYNTIEYFIIHSCSKADNNEYRCAHCCCVLSTIDELHDCEGTRENKKLNNSNTDKKSMKPPSENQHSIETKYYNCNLCRISFETSQELDNHNCTSKVTKSGNSTAQSLSCSDCAGKFESYDELIGHICHNPKFVLVQDELKIDEDDSSTLTAVTDTSATETANSFPDVIDIDSDSDTEFVEPNFHHPARVVNEICPVDMREASQLISQGIPVVTPNHLQYQPLMMPMLPLVSVNGQEGVLLNMTNNGFPIMDSEARAYYMNSGGRVIISNGNGQNGDTPIMWPSVSDTTQNVTRNLSPPNLLPINALKKSVENIMPAVPLNTPKTAVTNNDNSVVISDDETENFQQNFSSTMSCVNDEMKENSRRSKWPTEEQNNYICISDDDEIQEMDQNVVTLQEQPTNKETKTKIKRPPTSFFLYKEKLKPELDRKFPLLKHKERMQMAADTWKSLALTEKWPFMEEARLLRELFRREHPELCSNSKPQRKKPVPKKPAKTHIPVMPQISAVFTLVDTPIVLD